QHGEHPASLPTIADYSASPANALSEEKRVTSLLPANMANTQPRFPVSDYSASPANALSARKAGCLPST
ncbi:hypothetical protein BaRGS_00019870, partial [Batillaria attramentaria]